MPNMFTQGSLAFEGSALHAEKLLAVFEHDWNDEGAEVPDILQSHFATREQFLNEIAEGDDYFEASTTCVEYADDTIYLYDTENFQPYVTALLLKSLVLADTPGDMIGFTWADTCDKPRADQFGGGWCLVTSDKIEFSWARTELQAAMRECEAA